MAAALSGIGPYMLDRWRAGERLYAIIDAARAGDLFQSAIERHGLLHQTLFEGRFASVLDHVAPHLITLHAETAFFDEWLRSAGRAAGVLLGTPLGAKDIREHLRRLFVVRDEAGVEYSFRYYDPRVLRMFLPTCSAAQAAEFFGPMSWVLVEGEAPPAFLRCTPGAKGAAVEPLTFAAAAAAAPAGARRA